MGKVEGKSIYVSDTTKVMRFSIAQVMALKINYAAEDEGIEKIFQYCDDHEPQQQVANSIYLNEVLEGKDPRTKSKKVKEAVKKGLNGLYYQCVFEDVHRKDIPSNAVVLPSKFVYERKNVGTED